MIADEWTRFSKTYWESPQDRHGLERAVTYFLFPFMSPGSSSLVNHKTNWYHESRWDAVRWNPVQPFPSSFHCCTVQAAPFGGGHSSSYHPLLRLRTPPSLRSSGCSKEGDALWPYIILKLNCVHFSFSSIRWGHGCGRYFTKYRKHRSK